VQEGCHLSSGDVSARAVPVVGGRVAALRYSCCAQPVNVAFKDGIIVIGEQVAAAIIGVMQGSDQERSHLLSCDFPIGAELGVSLTRVAALRYPSSSEAFLTLICEAAGFTH
jgi:hypothetical protein